MRILLVNPSDTMRTIMGGARVFVHRTEPLGILYIAAVLEADGHEVEVIDAWARCLSLEEVLALVLEGAWDLVGFNTLTSNGEWVYRICKRIKEVQPETRILLGNVHASVYASFFLEQGCCDFVAHGEAEYIVRDLCRALERNTSVTDVGGLSLLVDGAPKRTGQGSVVQNLDELPIPSRHLVDMRLYTSRNFVTKINADGAYRVMLATRGCPFACTFCVVNADRNYRRRSPRLVVDEMELLVQEYDASFIEFLDPLFTVNKEHIIEVCKQIVDRRIQVEWQCEGHVNTVNEEVLRWMKRAGCRNMAFGIETASEETIKRVRKGSSPSKARAAVTMANNAGISAHGLFIIGFPGETPAQAQETVDFALSLPIDFAQFSILIPYPGSDIYRDLVAQGRLDQEATAEERVSNWKRYSAYLSFTDLEPIFVPDGWTPEALKAMQRSAIRRYYLQPRQVAKEIAKFRPADWRLYVEGVRTVFSPEAGWVNDLAHEVRRRLRGFGEQT